MELAWAALNAFAELDEGLAGPERMSKFFVQDVITTFTGFMEERVTLRGADEFVEFRATWMEPYDDFLYEPKAILDAEENRVVVILHQRGRPHGSDAWVEMDYGMVYTVEGGMIRRADFYASPEKALEAAGLRE